MSNVNIGNKTERQIISVFNKYGYWVYNTPHKVNGQPVDIIAIRKNNAWLVDAKHLESRSASFSFDRIEPNQITTCLYASTFAQIDNVGFAIEYERTGGVYWFPFKKYQELDKQGCKSVKIADLSLLEDYLKGTNQNG